MDERHTKHIKINILFYSIFGKVIYGNAFLLLKRVGGMPFVHGSFMALSENLFLMNKRYFRHLNVNCRCLVENMTQLQTMFVLPNLCMARRALL